MKSFAVFLVVCLVVGANAFASSYHSRSYDANNDGLADYADRNLDGKVHFFLFVAPIKYLENINANYFLQLKAYFRCNNMVVTNKAKTEFSVFTFSRTTTTPDSLLTTLPTIPTMDSPMTDSHTTWYLVKPHIEDPHVKSEDEEIYG